MNLTRFPDPSALTPIESVFWTSDGEVPGDGQMVVRGSPITPEKLLTHDLRQAREYSFRGTNMFSVSGDVVMDRWPLERILSRQLATYSRYATAGVSELRAAGFELVATGASPHIDIVLPSPDTLWAERLAELLRPHEQRNPSKSRR